MLLDFNNFRRATSTPHKLLLHYFLKCKSRSLAVYSSEFIPGRPSEYMLHAKIINY